MNKFLSIVVLVALFSSMLGSTAVAADQGGRIPAPLYSCDRLWYSRASSDTTEFFVSATAENGAEIVNYTIYFGDGTRVTSREPIVNHTFTSPGMYRVTVFITFQVNRPGYNSHQVLLSNSVNCEVVVVVEGPPEIRRA